MSLIRNDRDDASRSSATTQLLSDISDVTRVTYLMTSQALHSLVTGFLSYPCSPGDLLSDLDLTWVTNRVNKVNPFLMSSTN